MNNRDKATYLSYALGLAMFNSLEIMMLELKTGDKVDQKLYKEKIKDKVKLHQSFSTMFPNAKQFLNKKDVDKLNDAILSVVDSLWT